MTTNLALSFPAAQVKKETQIVTQLFIKYKKKLFQRKKMLSLNHTIFSYTE